MGAKRIRCINRVGGTATCQECDWKMIKYGKSASGEQRFQCKKCKRTQIEFYQNRAYLKT